MRMIKKVSVVIFLLVCLGAAAWWSRSDVERIDPPASTTDGIVADGRSISSPNAYVPTPPGRNGASAPLSLGGPGLNLQRVYREGLAARGSDDAHLASVISMSRAMCSSVDLEDAERWQDPERRWAMRYLKSACDGFDSDDYRYTGVTKNALWYMAKVGDKEAAEAALSDIHRSDDMLEVGIASQYLIERDLLPDQANYGLPKEDLLKVASMAGKLQTCSAMSACGSDSLITAELCARNGCPPGTSYVNAVRRELSPRQFEALVKMREFMSKR